MNSIHQILIILRQTRNCYDELHNGVMLSRQLGAEICVLAVFSEHFGIETVSDPEIYIGFDNYFSVHDQFKTDLEAAIQAQKKAGIRIKYFTSYTDSIKNIEHIVENENIDLIVLQAHEKGRLEHLLFGGENDALIRKLPCSLYLMKQERVATEEPVMIRQESSSAIA